MEQFPQQPRSEEEELSDYQKNSIKKLVRKLERLKERADDPETIKELGDAITKNRRYLRESKDEPEAEFDEEKYEELKQKAKKWLEEEDEIPEDNNE